MIKLPANKCLSLILVVPGSRWQPRQSYSNQQEQQQKKVKKDIKIKTCEYMKINNMRIHLKNILKIEIMWKSI